MALQQRIERVEEQVRTTSAYDDQPLPALILAEVEELNRREAALPVRSSAKARKLIASAVVGGAASWGLVFGLADFAMKLVA